MKRRIIVLLVLLGILGIAAVAIQFGPNVLTAVQQHQSASSTPTTPQGQVVTLKNGIVAKLSGDCSSGVTFVIGDYTISAGRNVAFTNGACSDLQNGAKVTVQGVADKKQVTATHIEIVAKAAPPTLLDQAQSVATLSWQKASTFVVYALTDPSSPTTVNPANIPAGYFLIVRDGEYMYFAPGDQQFTLPSGKAWHLTIMLSSGVTMEQEMHPGVVDGNVTQMPDDTAYNMMFGSSPDGNTNSVAYKSVSLQTGSTVTILPGFVGELVVNGQHILLSNPGTFTVEGLVGTQTGTLFVTHVETQGNLNSVANSQVTLQPNA